MNRIKNCILALSLGFNLAFAGVWVSRNISPLCLGPSTPPSLHQHIGVTEEQWAQLSPLVNAFKTASKEQGKKIKALRCRLLDLLEAQDLNNEAIESTQNQLHTLTLDMKKKGVSLLLGEKTVLSPKQYSALIKEVRKKTCGDQGGLKKGGSVMRILIHDPDLNER